VNFINIAETKLRAGNARCCACCGRKLQPKRSSRRQRFCDAACRQTAYRAKKWTARNRGPKALRSVEKTRGRSNGYGGHFADGASRICAPGAVIEAEIFGRREWRAVTSPDGVVCKVAAIKFGAA
jgi:hypothetical protein